MMRNANTCTLQGVVRNANTSTLQDVTHNATTSTLRNVTRNASTCACNIILPVRTSTPNCSPRRMVDCCPNVSIIENSCPQSSVVISRDSCDLDDEIVLQCSASDSSGSINSEPNMTCCKRAAQKQLNNTYDLTCKSSREKTKTCLSTKTCPSTVEIAKEWLTTKTCELKHKIQDLVYPKASESKHVNFSNSCKLKCKHDLDPSPCQSIESCNQGPDSSCERCNLTQCSCRHVEISDNPCEHCKDILNSAPCKLDTSCKHCDVSAKLCKQCKHIFDSAPCLPDEPCKLVGIADKVCELCKLVLYPPDDTCKHCDITKKLCNECKLIVDSAPCIDRSCKNVDIASMLCEQCKHVYDSAPCHNVKPCMKLVDITVDKSCEQCKGISNPATCKTVQISKKCDISTKLCKKCINLFDSAPCADRSCKNVEIANKFCEHCKHIYMSGSCQSIEPCKEPIGIVDKSCGTCTIFPQVGPCQSENSCKDCDIVQKLCNECKLIFEFAPCIDRSCKNVEIVNMLCKQCRNIYDSAICHQAESCEKLCKVKCESDRDPSPCQSVNSVVLFDIDKSCERCKHVPDSALCQPVTSCEHVYIQVPEEGLDCDKFEELFFNDKATGCLSPVLGKCKKCSAALESQSAATLTTSGSIIKQEAKSTCFDITKESICRSSGSGPESPGGSCASARARYFQNKLLATLQILQNKEETVRVQAESIAIAESRIAALNARHTDLRKEIDRKEREIQCLRKEIKECRACRVNTFDVSVTAEIQDMDDQKNIVTTLQNNLGVIEDLYRECFYETVKQDNLIEMLRKSYLDVRLMDKDKSDRITKLHNVINTQKWSLDRCQDIATEVDNLKVEISNFINSSNNDSGMWEESVVGGLSEDLQDIAAQLLTLRDLLTGECTCGLEQENKRLREENECIQGEICGLRTKMYNLEDNLQKSCDLHRQCQEQVECKERELQCMHGQFNALIETASEKDKCYDLLKQQFTENKALLDDKSTELCCLQKQCRDYEDTIQDLKEELNKSAVIAKENEDLRKELCCVSRRGARVQRRAAELEAELTRAREHCGRIEAAYREETATAAELERQLGAAHARGAELCAEAGRVLRAVRCWAARMREIHREQEKQIEQKECKLRYIQNELHRRQLNLCPRMWEQIEEDCSACPSASGTSKRSEGCPPTFCAGESRREGTGSSGSEMASCSWSPAGAPCASSTPLHTAAAPGAPPRQREPACALRVEKRRPAPAARDACVQRPARRDAGSAASPRAACARCRRLLPAADVSTGTHRAPVSPGEEMFSRMETLSAALADRYKRWSRRAPT